jgi:hypothetical protein
MAASSAANMAFTVTMTTKKGRGLIADIDIPCGSLVFSEKPLLTLYAWARSEHDYQTPHAKLLTDFAELPKHKKRIILENLSISDTADFQRVIFQEFRNYKSPSWRNFNRKYGHNAQKILTAFSTNAIGPHLGTQAAMLNHSCVPNAYATFEDDIQELTVHALRDINYGEEICISYLEGAALFQPALPQPGSSRATRREFLQIQRGFDCLCEACLEVSEWVADQYQLNDHPSERLRAELCDLITEYRRRDSQLWKKWSRVNSHGLEPDSIRYLVKIATGIVELIEQLGLTSIEHLEWYEAIAKWERSLEDEEAAAEWQGKIRDIVHMCLGRDSRDSKHLLRKV